MIVGIAVPTMLRSRAARAIAAMIPTVTKAWLRVIGGSGAGAAAADECIAVESTEPGEDRASRDGRGGVRFGRQPADGGDDDDDDARGP